MFGFQTLLQDIWQRIRSKVPENFKYLFTPGAAKKLDYSASTKRHERKKFKNPLENIDPKTWSNLVFVSDVATIAVGESCLCIWFRWQSAWAGMFVDQFAYVSWPKDICSDLATSELWALAIILFYPPPTPGLIVGITLMKDANELAQRVTFYKEFGLWFGSQIMGGLHGCISKYCM
jgi:hypothetical protein